MKKTHLKKIPLVIAPIALVATPLLIFSMKVNPMNDVEKNNNFNHQVEKLINNNKISLKDKITEFYKKLLEFKNNTGEIFANLKQKIIDWENLFKVGRYLDNFDLQTKLSNQFPSKFKNFKNQLIQPNELNLKQNLEFKSTTFAYKLVDFNDYEGNLLVEVELKYETKFSLKTIKKISGFKIFNQTSNNDFKTIEGFFNSLAKKNYYDISDQITINDKVSHLLEKIIKKNFNATKLVSLTSKKNDILLQKIINSKNIVTVDIKITDLKNGWVKEFPLINFKISRNSRKV